MLAHERALEWQELFDIAVREDVSEEDIVDVGYRVAGALWVIVEMTVFLTARSEDLSSKKRYKEAAQVLLDYCKAIRDAVIALTSGNMFSEARRIVSRLFRFTYGTLILLPIGQPQLCTGIDRRCYSSSCLRKPGTNFRRRGRDERAN